MRYRLPRYVKVLFSPTVFISMCDPPVKRYASSVVHLDVLAQVLKSWYEGLMVARWVQPNVEANCT